MQVVWFGLNQTRSHSCLILDDVSILSSESTVIIECVHGECFTNSCLIDLLDVSLHQLCSRNFVTSGYCMQEFGLAHHRMVHGDKKYLIPVLLEPLDIDALPRNLQMYLRTHTYIDATKTPRTLEDLAL